MKVGELGENSLYWMGLCLVDVNQVEKAKKVFEALAQSFPEGPKICTTMFKLSAIYAAEGNVDMQKQYLQKILATKLCEKSAEFEQAAEMLQSILELEEKKASGATVEACEPVVRGTPKPSSAAPAESQAPAAP
jgi:tetratricopeptide (TPR) repeat protein